METGSEHEAIHDCLVALLSDRYPHLLQPFLRLSDAVTCQCGSSSTRYRELALQHLARAAELADLLADRDEYIDDQECYVRELEERVATLEAAEKEAPSLRRERDAARGEVDTLQAELDEERGAYDVLAAENADYESSLREDADFLDGCGCAWVMDRSVPQIYRRRTVVCGRHVGEGDPAAALWRG